MRRKRKGQSLVEMALLLPFMLFILFAIIDLGWYVFNYATVYNAARRGSEKASQLPPYDTRLDDETDGCSGAILFAAREGVYQGAYRDAGSNQQRWTPGLGGVELYLGDNVFINYPNGDPRKLGEPIEVIVNVDVQPLTPLLTLGRTFGLGSLGPDGNPVISIHSTSRRTVEGLGINPEFNNGLTCQP
jgi:hypothetical protein